MSTPKPTVILIHGAWHSPEHFQPLETALSSHGYRTVSPWLPSVHYEKLNAPPVSSILDDIVAIRQTIVSELSAHPAADVVLLSHSYGAVVASAAIEGLDKFSRGSAGHQNGVIALLIIAGLLAPPGTSLLDWSGGQVPPTMLISTVPYPGDPSKREIEICTCVPDPGPVALFYHDVAEQDPLAAQRYASLCMPQIWAVWAAEEVPVPFAAWQAAAELDLDVFYLVTEDDRALPPVFQRAMIDIADREIAAARQPGDDGARKSIHVTAIKSGHSPFLSRVEETAQWVRRCCGERDV
ncbi:uncharacterized protein A1O5_01159 [Cladophialophora psammophila CBS 110553]|uniref:AB hydrolase-1 domain-containing protein n=1 Tax=Cladophialophora psammophila CBS 110553 TaxID=1182543 RepID=W9XI64_9EURO|nr:uncharacterized protein A1O5_01159 [Cladophialophora psammophila CBS 110553]EXJ76651.1 hypothetical protein A1O5_01159 [Cladophialophora psammophila CBS 110553]